MERADLSTLTDEELRGEYRVALDGYPETRDRLVEVISERNDRAQKAAFSEWRGTAIGTALRLRRPTTEAPAS